MAVTVTSAGGEESLIATPTTSTLALKGLSGQNGVSINSDSNQVIMSLDPATINALEINIPNIDPISFRVNTSSIESEIDIYTVPAGKKLLLMYRVVYNVDAGNSTDSGVTYHIKKGSNYYTVTNFYTFHVVLEEGETVAYSNASTTNYNIFFNGVLFDATHPLKTVWNLSLTSGYNTIYTCPAGKKALLLKGPINIPDVLRVGNFTGGIREYGLHVVKNAESPSSSNKMARVTNSPGNSLWSISGGGNITLTEGDSIVLSSDSSAGAQYAFGNVYELDA